MNLYTTQIMMLSFMQAISNFTGAKLEYEYSVKNPSGVSTTSSASIVPETTENPININLNTLLGSILENSIVTKTETTTETTAETTTETTATATATADAETETDHSIETQLATLQVNYKALEARMIALEAKMQALT